VRHVTTMSDANGLAGMSRYGPKQGADRMEWYLEVLRKYAVFTGRARRREFWTFTLISVIISIVLGIIDAVIGTDYASGYGVLGTIYGLAVVIPSIAVGIRRLHDINRAGWWILIALIPIIGFIVLIVFYFTEGTRGDNRYGPDPKAVAVA
jgi:uncharacterized membrane protein YhaH (DUF805 family)